MKILPTQFTELGFVHTQLTREGKFAIYKRKGPREAEPHFEVIRINSHNGFLFPGADKAALPAEMYPGPKQWGTNGWTFTDYDRAIEKFNSLKGITMEDPAFL